MISLDGASLDLLYGMQERLRSSADQCAPAALRLVETEIRLRGHPIFSVNARVMKMW